LAYPDGTSRVCQKKENRKSVGKAAPLPGTRPFSKIGCHPDRQREMEERQMAVKGAQKWDCDIHDRGEDDGSVAEDHGENKPEKDPMEHGIIMRPRDKESAKE
jgi:hypothetical protein